MSHARGAEGEARWTLARLGLAIFLSMNVLVFTMVLWAGDVYHDPAEPAFSQAIAACFRYLGLLFSLPVMWILGIPLAQNAWRTTLQGRLSTDLLIAFGVASAFAYSVVSVLRGAGPVYFEVACIVLVMITLGRWLEATGRARAHSTLQLLEKLLPETAIRLCADTDLEERVPIEALRARDRIRVRPGQRTPADAVVLRGTASLDEQILTGESEARPLEPGQAVRAGSLNLDGDLTLELTAAPREGTWQRLVAAVEQARRVKGYYERLTDQLSRVFLPLVIVLALTTFAWHSRNHGLEAGLMAGLAVALISCPCALGLATPLAILVAHGEALRRGVLFASSEALERLSTVRVVACDKTGTLTTGNPRLLELVLEDERDRGLAHGWAARLAGASDHALSRGVRESLEHCEAEDFPECQGLQVRSLSGQGLKAEAPDGAGVAWLGSPRFLEQAGLQRGPRIGQALELSRARGEPAACIGWAGRVRGAYRFEETLRAEAVAFAEGCRAAGLPLVILTGDLSGRGRRVAEQLQASIHEGLLPDDKVTALADLRAAHGPVVMIGDGINDAPVLAASDVGFALGCGADVARSAADVCLMGNDLRQVPWTIRLASRTRQTIRQNLAWSLFYNVLGIGLAMHGTLNPVFAAAAMVLGSALVVGNSMRWKLELDAQQESTDGACVPSLEAHPVLSEHAA